MTFLNILVTITIEHILLMIIFIFQLTSEKIKSLIYIFFFGRICQPKIIFI